MSSAPSESNSSASNNNERRATSPKRTRFDPSAAASEIGIQTTPSQAAESRIVQHTAALPSSISSLVKSCSKRYLDLQMQLRKKATNLARLTTDTEYFPKSTKLQFKLSTFDSLENNDSFKSCQQAVETAMLICQKALKAQIIACIDLEILSLQKDIQNDVCQSLGDLARIYCHRHGVSPTQANNLVKYTIANHGSDIFKHVPVEKDPNNLLSPVAVFINSYNTINRGHGEPISWTEPPEESDDETVRSVDMLASPQRRNRVPEHNKLSHADLKAIQPMIALFPKTCQVIFFESWQQYKSTATENQREIDAKVQAQALIKERATAEPAMQIEELTINAKTLQQHLDEQISKSVKPLLRKISTLEHRAANRNRKQTPSPKNQRAGARNRGVEKKQNSDSGQKDNKKSPNRRERSKSTSRSPSPGRRNNSGQQSKSRSGQKAGARGNASPKPSSKKDSSGKQNKQRRNSTSNRSASKK